MTDKYVDVSLTTGANDGTSPANAWQSLVDVLDGSPANGSLDPGDVVHVRTADGSGNNLEETRTAGLTTPAQPLDNPVIWRFDDGTIWSQGGTFVFRTTSSASWVLHPGNVLDALRGGQRRLRLVYDNNTADGYILGAMLPYDVRGVEFWRGESIANNRDPRVYLGRDSGRHAYGRLYRCQFKLVTNAADTARPTAGGGWILFDQDNAGLHVFDDCEFIMNPHVDDAPFNISNLRSGEIHVLGGTFTGTATNHTIVTGVTTLYGGRVLVDRADTGLISFAGNIPGTVDDGRFTIIAEGLRGSYDFFLLTNTGTVEWDGQGNFPTLNAVLPTGDPWSIKVWPHSSHVSEFNPHHLAVTEKVYNQPDAAITVTVELLIKDTPAFANPQKDEWWIDVSYWGTDGAYHRETSKASGALATSSAGWSSTAYGANSYDPYKVELTTAQAVKQNTMLRVDLYSTRPAVNDYNSATGDFYFVDPDVQFS